MSTSVALQSVNCGPTAPAPPSGPQQVLWKDSFDVDLYPGSVGREQVHGHAPLFQDQDGVITVGGQRGLDDLLIGLAEVFGCYQQVPRGRCWSCGAPSFAHDREEREAMLTSYSNFELPNSESLSIHRLSGETYADTTMMSV